MHPFVRPARAGKIEAPVGVHRWVELFALSLRHEAVEVRRDRSLVHVRREVGGVCVTSCSGGICVCSINRSCTCGVLTHILFLFGGSSHSRLILYCSRRSLSGLVSRHSFNRSNADPSFSLKL